MVSSALKVGLPELLATLERMRGELAGDLEYRLAREQLPDDWPL